MLVKIKPLSVLERPAVLCTVGKCPICMTLMMRHKLSIQGSRFTVLKKAYSMSFDSSDAALSRSRSTRLKLLKVLSRVCFLLHLSASPMRKYGTA